MKVKFKLSPREKNSIFAFLTVVIVLLTITIMLFPEFIDYQNSISNLSDKSDSIEAVANKLDQNEGTIKSLKQDIEMKHQEAEKVKEDADLLKSRVNTRSFELHVPSLLVTLEETARKKDINITVEYSQLTAVSSDFTQEVVNNFETPGINGMKNPSEDVNSPNREIVMTNPNDEIPTSDDVVDDLDTNESLSNDQDSPANNNKPSNFFSNPNRIKNKVESGMSVASVPIKVEGDFLKIRDFIQMLDVLDFVEPVHIELDSDGESVQAGILLNIYYGEVN